MMAAVQTAAQKRPANAIGGNSRHADKPILACQECGREFVQTQPTRFFCSDPCKQSHNNRRQKRGAEVYDAVMAWRFERGLAKALGLFPLICRMASIWREEDREQRAGRKSWSSPRAASQRLNHYRATTVFRPRRCKP